MKALELQEAVISEMPSRKIEIDPRCAPNEETGDVAHWQPRLWCARPGCGNARSWHVGCGGNGSCVAVPEFPKDDFTGGYIPLDEVKDRVPIERRRVLQEDPFCNCHRDAVQEFRMGLFRKKLEEAWALGAEKAYVDAAAAMAGASLRLRLFYPEGASGEEYAALSRFSPDGIGGWHYSPGYTGERI